MFSCHPLPPLSFSFSLHIYAHTLCRRKDHTLSQPVCETQRQSCSLFSLCNVLVRKTLIFGAAQSALLHHRTILIVNMAFSIFTFHDKKNILHANDFSGQKNISHCCLGVAYILHQTLLLAKLNLRPCNICSYMYDCVCYGI